MKISTAVEKAKKKGFKGTFKYCAKKICGKDNTRVAKPKINILLLTNRDSDNVGDQVIEACDISLLRTVMENLKQGCKINSSAASIVSQKYLQTREERQLEAAENAIQKADVVIFGGAPMFNYLYQNFYERTAVTLELAQKYQKPVIFSAIGIEGYGDDNKKCQRLKETLNFDCVKQITTRDDFEALQRYKENPEMKVAKVADPAVFSDKIFENYKVDRKPEEKKKIGIFVLRQNGFVDNKIDFSKDEAAAFWVELGDELERRGYDYEFVTSGHFGDEAYLDYLIRKYNVSPNKCVFNMDSPETLVGKISSYAAVVSCRLHPSIVSFALDVPSLGIVWNPKVRGFYSSIGYTDRVMETRELSATAVAERLEQLMDEGVVKHEDFLMSIYNSLFYGIQGALGLEADGMSPYSYRELMEKLPVYQGTSEKEREEKLKRKFRRTYKTCNDRFEKNLSLQKRVDELERELKELTEKKG